VVRQIVIIFAATQGLVDDLKVDEIRAFELGLYPFMESSRSAVLDRIRNEKAFNDELRAELMAALLEYKDKFRAEKTATAAATQ
jgi:F-type H+-transporting ATPase subunit alpha